MKKVFIGVLAALMLFAFTACEPQTITWPSSKDVSYLTIEQVKDYIEGEKATDDGFNVVIHYTDETVSEPISGVAKVGTKTDAGYPVTAEITFSGDTQATKAISTLVEFKPVTGISVSGYDYTDENSAKKATVTLSYDGGTKTYAYEKIDFDTKAYVNNEEKETPVAGDVVTVYATAYTINEGTGKVNLSDEISIGTYTVPATVDSTFVEYKLEYGTTGVTGNWLGKDISYTKFTTVMSDTTDNVVVTTDVDKLFVTTPATGKFYVVAYSDGNPETKDDTFTELPKKFGEFPVTIDFIECDHPERGVKSLTIAKGNDYTVGLASDKTSFADSATYKAVSEADVSDSMLNMYVEKASDDTEHKTPVTSKHILTQSFETGTWSAQVLVSYPDEINGKTVSDIVAVTITDIPENPEE